jgi:NAD(P)-dependent dehydrogenase (short-subunit alcohol dehydrogenase family)
MMGKVAIITGGSRGIGARLVAGYRGQGWGVVASAQAIEPSEDADLVTVAADLTQRATAEQIVDAALRRFGRIDTLVNNASVLISKPFTDYTAADYATVVGVNLTGFFWLTQRAVDEMASRYGGHIVNIMATLAESADSATPAVLAALTNGALAAATRSLAIEYASYGVRVNAVSPSIIQTPVCSPESYDDLSDQLPPLGRPGRVSDVVDGVLFLESLSYITGEILRIDGTPKGQATSRENAG